jgi:hypothetical protein
MVNPSQAALPRGDGAGAEDSAATYVTTRDTDCWQLERSEPEAWELLEGIEA